LKLASLRSNHAFTRCFYFA